MFDYIITRNKNGWCGNQQSCPKECCFHETSSLGSNWKFKGALPNIVEEIRVFFRTFFILLFEEHSPFKTSSGLSLHNAPVITPSALFAMFSSPNSTCEFATGRDSNLFLTLPVKRTELCDCLTNQFSKRFSISVKSSNLSWLGVGSVMLVGVACVVK